MGHDEMNDQLPFFKENQEAEECITLGDLPGAARLLVDIVDKDPDNWRAYNNMGIISWTRKAWLDAYTMFDKSVSLKPDYLDAIINLFDAGLKLHRIDRVFPRIEQAHSLLPDNKEITVLYESIQDQGDEIYSSQRALTIGIYNPRIEEAQQHLEDGELFKAMDLFLKVNDTEGPNADAYCGLGIISYYQERFDDAFSLFFESIKLNPALPDTFLNLLDAAKACGKTDIAHRIYEEYLKNFSFLDVIRDEFEKKS